MTPITHHLDDATLMSFAAGSLPQALSTVVATHLAVCPACATEARRMDVIGGALLAGLTPVRMDQAAPVMQLRRDEAGEHASVETVASSREVPLPLARLVGPDLDRVPWRRLGLGVWHHKLPSGDGDLRLLKVAAGRRMPEHGHGGSELTMMLRGSYSDVTGTYRSGDVADLDDSVEHSPIADAETGCICLIASELPANFKGLLSRLVQPLTGM
jgi:putative transcriptional regulator